jgi:UDP-N-acetylmuramate--alanine ligase
MALEGRSMSLNPESRILNPSSAHLIGICGSGMRSLAEYLLEANWRVSGSDAVPVGRNADALRARHIAIHPEHAAEHVAGAAAVIYSPAIPDSNPERVAARERDIPQYSYPEMLGRLMAGRTGFAVAGTHGKSTTTAMLGWIAHHAGLDPSVICGAELLNRGLGGWAGGGEALIVEACEYRGSFFHLRPRHAALLDLELDHFDCYADLDAAIAAYAEFLQRLPADGLAICRADRPAVAAATAALRARVETFGIETAADWTARHIRTRPGRTSFRIERNGTHWTDCALCVPGMHNVLNALAAAALATELGLAPAAVRRALAEFRGVRRRCERLGSRGGVEFVDDYAHHPTAVAATLTAVSHEFPGRRIICAFQPHQVSRTRRLLSDLAGSLSAAREVLILPVYAARESPRDATDAARELVAEVSRIGTRARFVPSLDRLVRTLETDPRPGDVVVLIGAGDIDRVRDEFSARLLRHYAS